MNTENYKIECLNTVLIPGISIIIMEYADDVKHQALIHKEKLYNDMRICFTRRIQRQIPGMDFLDQIFEYIMCCDYPDGKCPPWKVLNDEREQFLIDNGM